MALAHDLTGQKFGRLTVICRTPKGARKTRNAVWCCLCECGRYTDVIGSLLVKGVTKSCGCYRHDVLKARTISEEQRRKIIERNSCDYDGLNGYGHTKKHKSGYILAYVPKHPRATKDGYVMLHTVLAEMQLNRYLKENEVVHHINHIRDDNRIENLQLMDRHEHCSMHMKERHQKRRA